MGELAPRIAPMSPAAVDAVRKLEEENLKRPQVHIPTDHVLHAGMYARTIMVPAGVVLTGALIKIATILVVSGNAIMYGEGGAQQIVGYSVLSASAGRKQAFVAVDDTYLTMMFVTEAQTVMDAEAEFTDEADLLFSRREA